MKKYIKDTSIRNQLYSAFREFTETESSDNLEAPDKGKPKARKSNRSSSYNLFLVKYSKLSKSLDSFKPIDFVFLFREIARESGFKYMIANFQKDLGIFKKLMNNYENKEIYEMIDFVFNSEQDYLDKSKLSPNLLVSQWCNTIYPDSQLYAKGEYSPNIKSKRIKQLKNREWSESYKEEKGIGEW